MMKFRLINIKESRPATLEEIEKLMDEDDEQLFFNWSVRNITKENEGIVSVDLDSGLGADFRIEAV